MANVAVSVQDAGHVTTTNLVAAIQAAGHAATAVADSTLTAASLADYDVIFCVRARMTTAMAAIYRGYIAAGKRLYWGFLAGTTAGGGYTTGAGALKMCASENVINAQTPTSFASSTKATIFYRMGSSEGLHATGNTFYETFNSPAADAVVTATADAGGITGFILPPGAKDTAGVAFGAACGVFGGLYSTTTFSARGILAIKSLIEFDPVVLSGMVVDSTGAPTQRVLRAYDRVSGLLAGEVASDAVTGVYEFFASKGRELNVVCLDDTAGDTLNDLILRTTPT